MIVTKEPLKLEYLDNGCLVPTNRKLNKDGYYSITVNKRRVQYHKYLYQEKYGNIPKGYALHHLCGNRCCCNLDHLILLSNSDHTKLHNWFKYGGRKQAAKVYWLKEQCTGITLGNLYGVSWSMAARWIRQWKSELIVTHIDRSEY